MYALFFNLNKINWKWCVFVKIVYILHSNYLEICNFNCLIQNLSKINTIYWMVNKNVLKNSHTCPSLQSAWVTLVYLNIFKNSKYYNFLFKQNLYCKYIDTDIKFVVFHANRIWCRSYFYQIFVQHGIKTHG